MAYISNTIKAIRLFFPHSFLLKWKHGHTHSETSGNADMNYILNTVPSHGEFSIVKNVGYICTYPTVFF